ncbi:cytochrome-c peroxidase [Filimonas effusa]|uniref:Cytochrome-c peroxidase n=2 Tax=Filimonas effusa TaxID=2508721 RepID=A0A4Q1DDC4_9BACT|nr:cytochrome-c peroxidase [Filimonas effusa]
MATGMASSFIARNKPRYGTTPMAMPIPKGWPQPVYNFRENQPTREGFELGRRLFYDGRLSKDGNFPCAGCHQQFAAFATFDHSLSHGVDNQLTTRNAPALFNLAWQKEFMHDGGVNHLDLQPLAPLTASNEMGETISNVLQKLRADKQYRRMFRAAFGDTLINTQRMMKALSQFMLMMVSADSKYDKVKRGEAAFTLAENLGQQIFNRKCASCHPPPFFTDFSYRNIGLEPDGTLADSGRMRITLDKRDAYKFRVPSLRNVKVTAPYGHDGRFFSLADVFSHYRQQHTTMPGVDSLVKNGIPLSNFEIGQLTAFLFALTDSTLLSDKRFGLPPGMKEAQFPDPQNH